MVRSVDRDFAAYWEMEEFAGCVDEREITAAFIEWYKPSEGVSMFRAPRSFRPNHFRENCLCVFSDQLRCGLTLSPSDAVNVICQAYQLIPTLLTPNSFAIINGTVELFRQAGVRFDVESFAYFVGLGFPDKKGRALYFFPRRRKYLHFFGSPNGLHWKESYLLVSLSPPLHWGFDLRPGVGKVELVDPPPSDGAQAVVD